MRTTIRLSTALLLSVMGVASASAAAVAAQTEPAVVAVWALADGDTPLAGAHVRIRRDGRLLRQDDGTRRERTSRAGTSLLDLARLPRRFSVEVVPRRRLGGSLRALVRDYRGGQVVHVTPFTTLIADVVAAHRRRGRTVTVAHAERDVSRLLGIPQWQDQADLRHSDAHFDGDRYLRAARKAGGVAALNRTLVQKAVDHEGRQRFRRSRGVAMAAVDWISLLSDPTALVKEVFKSLITAALKQAGSKGGEAALGWVMSAFGLKDDFEARQLAEIRTALDAIGKQITRLENRVELGGFSTLVHQTDRTIGQIDYASNQLALLTALPAGDRTKPAFTQTIVSYIGANLRDAPDILNQNLTSNVPLSDNLIKSASRLVKTRRGRFFDSTDSAQVKSVYDYFATYQARLAVLLTEYFHALPDVYSLPTVQAEVSRMESKVTAQAQSLKPSVPKGAVVDSQKRLMWTQAATQKDLASFASIVPGRYWFGDFQWRPNATATGVPGLPFTNWSLPSSAHLSELIAGWSGDNPLAWLRKEARFEPQASPVYLMAGVAYRHVRTGNSTFELRATLQNYDLRAGKHEFSTGPRWDAPVDTFRQPGYNAITASLGPFRNYVRGALFVRPVPMDETYWWD